MNGLSFLSVLDFLSQPWPSLAQFLYFILQLVMNWQLRSLGFSFLFIFPPLLDCNLSTIIELLNDQYFFFFPTLHEILLIWHASNWPNRPHSSSFYCYFVWGNPFNCYQHAFSLRIFKSWKVIRMRVSFVKAVIKELLRKL